MICANCHTKNPAENKFCGACGEVLVTGCPNCGAQNPPGMRFCGQCGTSLDEASGALPSAPMATERRLVTVLFADLTGYTSFAEGRDSEDTRKFLAAYFDRSRSIIERFGGKIEKFIGDAVMAAWGAEIAHEDDAERAVRAGLELVEMVENLGKEEGAPELALRVGVNTGEAAVGPGEDHMGFVTGDLVNTASRLESAAEPGSVLVGEKTMESASRAIAFEEAGNQVLKGKTLPVAAWKTLRVLSEVGGRGRAETLEPPFIGRSDELRMLKDMLDSVGRESRTRMVSLIGEAGIGKSRLVWEFLKYVDGLVESTYWHEGRSPAYGDGVTFWAVAEMIRRRAAITETDADDVAMSKLNEALDTFVDDESDRAWIRPRVAAVLGIGKAPRTDRAELDSAVRAFFEGVAATGTTVLVFEDLHWADSALLQFVEELTDWWRDRPILIITMARPDLLERRPSWGTGRAGVVSLTLGPLGDQDMRRMVEGTIPGLPDAAVTTIVQRAAGVPLYAVELLRSLLAQGELEQDGTTVRVVGEIADIAVPESLQAIIGARLDRLDPDDRSLIQDAAVLGQTFSLEGLAVITEEDPDTLEHRLARLTKRELIEPIRDIRSPEHGQFRFLQGLIRDVALGRMSKDGRRARHLAVAEHMEGQNDPEIAVVVASHYLQALEATGPGDEQTVIRKRALLSIGAAADRAADLSAWEQVISIADKGLQLAETDEERAVFWEYLLEGEGLSGDRDAAEKFGLEAIEYHRLFGSDTDLWRVMRKVGYMYVNRGLRERAVKLLAEIVEGREDLDSDQELAKAAIVYSRAMMLQGVNVDELLGRAIAAAEKFDLKRYVVDGLITKASFSDDLGRLTEARILLEGAIAIADANDYTAEAARGRNNLGFIYGTVDIEVAIKAGAEALEAARRSGIRAGIQWHLSQEGFLRALLGDLKGWETISNDPMWDGASDDILASRFGIEHLVALLRGDIDQARSLLDQAETLVDPADPQARAYISGSRLGLEVFDGQFENVIPTLEGFAAGAEWWQTTNAAFPLVIAAAVSGDTEIVESARQHFVRIAPRLGESLRLTEAILAVSERVNVAVAEIDRSIEWCQRIGWISLELICHIAAARYLPADHPKRAGYRERAVALSSKGGFEGFLNLIERFVP